MLSDTSHWLWPQPVHKVHTARLIHCASGLDGNTSSPGTSSLVRICLENDGRSVGLISPELPALFFITQQISLAKWVVGFFVFQKHKTIKFTQDSLADFGSHASRGHQQQSETASGQRANKVGALFPCSTFFRSFAILIFDCPNHKQALVFSRLAPIRVQVWAACC